MNLHEHQTKELLSKYGVPRLAGRVAVTPDEAADAFKALGTPVCAVKAQIHAGGRGKAGGVKIVKSADEARAFAASILGKPLVTIQTGPLGRVVRKVFVEAGAAIEKEFYASIVLDRTVEAPVLIASREGGVEIETVAARDPNAILKEKIDPTAGLLPFQARKMAARLGLTGDAAANAAKVFISLARAYIDADASLLEINPLVQLKDNTFIALDGKMAIDERAVDQKPDLDQLRDRSEEDPVELEANEAGFSYVSMDGTIGCMVNGAGLAMSTMDIIKFHGGSPANFLDVGGGANKDQVTHAFKLLISNPKVKAILINIFGGILKCDVLAAGVVEAVREVGVKIPVVVRLEGTNVERGRQILKESGMKIINAADMTDAAQKVIAATK